MHLHALFNVIQLQLLMIQLPILALAFQLTRYLQYLMMNGNVHLFATQQRHIWIQLQTYVYVTLVIILLNLMALLHFHALFLVTMIQLLTVLLPMHALAKQLTRHLK